MANPWFRLYSEFQDDPDIQLLSEQMQRRFVMLLCSRCKTEVLTDTVIGFQWRMSVEDVAETKRVFIAAGFIDDTWTVMNWNKRQFVSDNTNDRVKKYRDKRQANGLPRGSNGLNDYDLYKRDCNCCIYCASTKNLCIDHIYPIILGGSDDYDNLAVACKACNSGKAGRTPEQAKYKIISMEAETRYRRYLTNVVYAETVTAEAM